MNARARILLIDEQADDMVLLTLTLQHFAGDAEVTTASTAVQFAEALAANPFDAVVADWRMSWGNGPQLLGAVKRRNPSCCTFLFTWETPESIAASGLPLQLDGYFWRSSKGYLEIAHAIRNAVDEARRRRRSGPEAASAWKDLPCGTFTLAADGTFRDANGALQALFGMPEEGPLIGRKLEDLLVDRAQRDAWRRVLAERTAVGDFDARVRGHQGQTRWVRIIAAPAAAPGGVTVMQGVVQDITALKQSGDLSEKTRALQRSNEELERIAYALSHDLQEPLQLVSGHARYVADRYRASLDEEARRFLGHVVDSASRMQSMIDDVLEYSRLAAKRTVAEPTDLNAVVDEAIGLLQPVIAAAGAEVSRGELPLVNADRRQMVQLFQNLISNAVKFRGPERLRVRVSAQEQETDWRIAVADNGIGIDPAGQIRIFGMFERLHTSEEYPGTGIGLAICKRIAESHGGGISVESARGRGATFYITIPKHTAMRENTTPSAGPDTPA